MGFGSRREVGDQTVEAQGRAHDLCDRLLHNGPVLLRLEVLEMEVVSGPKPDEESPVFDLEQLRIDKESVAEHLLPLDGIKDSGPMAGHGGKQVLIPLLRPVGRARHTWGIEVRFLRSTLCPLLFLRLGLGIHSLPLPAPSGGLAGLRTGKLSHGLSTWRMDASLLLERFHPAGQVARRFLIEPRETEKGQLQKKPQLGMETRFRLAPGKDLERAQDLLQGEPCCLVAKSGNVCFLVVKEFCRVGAGLHDEEVTEMLQ